MKKKKSNKKTTIIVITIIVVFLLVQNLFIGWRFSFGPFKGLGDLRMAKIPGNSEEYAMNKVVPLENAPLAGEKVLFLGSSVTRGESSLREGIPEYFAARMGWQITKEAVSGTTLADIGKKSYVQRLLNNIDPKEHYSLVIVQLSTNDAGKDQPLGDISEGFDASTFDTKTTTGAIEFIISYVRETWGCPVVFYTNAQYDNEAYGTLVERLLELQEKWDIGVLNLWSDDAFNAISEEERSLYMYDSVHPTKAGYRDWWCPEMERQLCQWLEEKNK
ncbi:MAG: SGNH/GDSL hydrolase family protein [Firmicutes bacterium]|nr:SGNH/GDSL hydrolase family protein [Bacillota bacterium]